MPNSCDSWPTIVKHFFLSLVIFTIFPGIFLTTYVTTFGAPQSSVLPHLSLISGLLAAVVGTRLISYLLFGAKTYRAVSAAIICFVGLAMLSFYGVVFVGLKYWGRVTTIEMGMVYARQAGDLTRALGYSPIIFISACAGIIFVSYFAAFVFMRRYDWVSSLAAKISKPVSGVVASLLLLISWISLINLPERDWGREGEPVSLSIYPEQGTMAMQSHSLELIHSSKIDRNDEFERLAYSPSKTAKQSNIILIVADALRADHLSLMGYRRLTTPGLEAQKRASTVRLATSAVSVCNESSCGLRGLVTSRYLDQQATKPFTLQEVLRRHNYRINLVFSGDHTNFYGLREIYGVADDYFDGTSQNTRYINDDRLVIDHLNGYEKWDGKPTMFQFHLMSSHVLGNRFDETPSFGPEASYVGLSLGSSRFEMPVLAENFYDRGVLQVDHVIEEILEKLKERGYLEDALVVITGDHGESLGERGRYVHTHSVWEEAIRVPFLLLSFGRAADVKAMDGGSVVSQVDIAPTLLNILGMPIPPSWEGISLPPTSDSRIVYFQQAQQIGLIDSRAPDGLYKYWIDLRSNEQFTYNLKTDPGELVDISKAIEKKRLEEWTQFLVNRSAALMPDLRKRLTERLPNSRLVD